LRYSDPAGAESRSETATIMRDVLDAIAYLLPLRVHDQLSSTTWDMELVDANLTTLRQSAGALSAHAAKRPPECGFLARSFDDPVHEIDRSFKGAWPSYANFSLPELT
jgi:hypothetical protein